MKPTEIDRKRGILLGRILEKCHNALEDYDSKGHRCPHGATLQSIKDMIEAHCREATTLEKKPKSPAHRLAVHLGNVLPRG